LVVAVISVVSGAVNYILETYLQLYSVFRLSSYELLLIFTFFNLNGQFIKTTSFNRNKPGAKERETLSISVDSQLVKMRFAKFV